MHEELSDWHCWCQRCWSLYPRSWRSNGQAVLKDNEWVCSQECANRPAKKVEREQVHSQTPHRRHKRKECE